jgi:acetoacetyl-CoA synthetase
VSDLPAFWHSLWDFFDLASPTPHHVVSAHADMAVDGVWPGC